MINYLKSEQYRLMHKKLLHLISIGLCLLITAAAFVLHFFGRIEENFPYATNFFFYSNVIGGGILLFFVILLVNSSLTGKDQLLLKQSLSFGISRNTIFWSKLILTLIYFLILCLIGMVLMVVLGENLFPKDNQALHSFLIASINMFPIVLSGFVLVHVLKMVGVGDAYTLIILVLIYTVSDNVVHLIFRKIEPLSEIYKFTPSAILNENMAEFLQQTVSFEWRYWIVGLIMTVILLLFGLRIFNKKDID